MFRGRRKSHVAMQKGAVRVGKPHGARSVFMHACMKKVVAMAAIAIIELRREAL
jgi:hypothetical protein